MIWPRKRATCNLEAGCVYSVERSNGHFGIVKILAFEPHKEIVYARIYKTRFDSRSRNDQLTEEYRKAANILPKLGMDIGVLPVTQRVFNYWKPELLFRQEIIDEEKENLAECFGLAKPWDDLKHP